MDRFYPHSELPEDQKYSKVILYSHLAHKGLQVGSIIGGLSGLFSYFVTKAGKASGLSRSFSKFSNIGALSGPIIISGVGYLQMRGKEKIEWQDRAWRLQRNEKLSTVDAFTDVSVLGSLLLPGTPIGMGVCASVASGIAYLRLFRN